MNEGASWPGRRPRFVLIGRVGGISGSPFLLARRDPCVRLTRGERRVTCWGSNK